MRVSAKAKCVKLRHEAKKIRALACKRRGFYCVKRFPLKKCFHSGQFFGLPKLYQVFGNYPKETQRKAGYNYTIDMHSVTRIKEAAHNFSLINIFFPPCNKEGNCKFVIRQFSKFFKHGCFCPQLGEKRQYIALPANPDLVLTLFK